MVYCELPETGLSVIQNVPKKSIIDCTLGNILDNGFEKLKCSINEF